MLQTANGWARGRVNPYVPAAAVLAGVGVAGGWSGPAGVGIAAGAMLAYVNGLLLSRRVDLAAQTGDMAGALLVMQLGLMVSLTIVAVVTIALARFSVAAAVGEVAGFGATHVLILGAYYWTHARRLSARETET
jgi:hypothetical protein